MIHTNTIEEAPGACDSKGLMTDTNDADFANHGPLNQALDGNVIAASQDLALTTTTAEPRVSTQQLAKHLVGTVRSVVGLFSKFKSLASMLKSISETRQRDPGASAKVDAFVVPDQLAADLGSACCTHPLDDHAKKSWSLRYCVGAD